MPLGTVVEYHREFCWVLPDEGTELIAKPRGRLELEEQQFARQVAVGDRVRLEDSGNGQQVIEEILPRETWLLRRNLAGSFRRKPQCVVANADQLCVVVAPHPEVRIAVIDRYFLAALLGGLEPVLVVNKLDLNMRMPDDPDLLHYRTMGYRVHFTSARTGAGIAELRDDLAGVFSAFCGHSGVGKSTILASITGENLRTGELTEKGGKGRQTTTTARMYQLPEGGSVVDTPGVREFAIAGLERIDVLDYFKDIAALTLSCQFRDCEHDTEPGCAVRAEIEAGRLSVNRLASFQSILSEADLKEWSGDRELEG